LHTIASTVNQTLHLDALLEVALDKVQEVTGKAVAFIRTLDRKANELVLRGHRGLSPEYVQATPTISVGVGGTGWVLQEKTSLYIPDVGADPRLSRWLHFMEGEWSYFGVPLMTKGEVIGTLSVASRRRDDFTPEDQRLIEAIAGPIGVAVENANLYQDLHDYSATLEEKVRERTQELEIVNQHKSEFLATMSHELRTPLNAIIGFCELLTDQLGATVSDRHQRYLSNIHTSGRHLLDLINGILDLSKVESGKMDLHYEEVPLAELIQQVFAGVGPQAQAKTLAFSWQVEDELDRVSLDAGKLKQILYNLVGNAIKFTPDGGSVTVTAKRVHGSQFMVHGRRGTDHEPSTLNHEPPAELLEISVADTGIGIKPEDQTRVFEPFQQIETSLGRKYPGTGLGLALTRKLVELHGGEIRVESTPGQGSTFTFTLALPSPVPPSGRRPEAPAAKPRPVETSEETAGDPARPLILVVEDDPKAIDLMVSYLQEGGYRVAVARNGEEALAQAKALHPLAITLDVLFPTVEGWHILEQLKAAPETQGIPVVVVSIVDDRPKGLQLGATEYLVKPVTRKGLLAALARQGVPSPDLQEIRVLAIDDDPVILDLFKGLLHMQGVSLLTATNGADGIRLAHSRKPDLIILDLMMPGMSGFEVLERLRADPTTAATPIFICSAKILTPEERDLLQEQAQRILQKGVFSPSDLLAEIATIRGRQGKHRSKGMRTRC
ncbi:MAG: response regulator, partial [Candidatus Methylomirabilales bacterium]